jgi:hypothetical protein
MGENKDVYRILVGKPEGKRPQGRPKEGGIMILEWILERQDEALWTGLMWLRRGTTDGTLVNMGITFESHEMLAISFL